MSDSSNPYDPQRSTFPWQDDADKDDVWNDAEPVVPLNPPPAVTQPEPGEGPAAAPQAYAPPAQYGQAQAGQPQYGQTQYGQAPYGQASYGQAQQPGAGQYGAQQGQAGYATPAAYGQGSAPAFGRQPVAGQPQPGHDYQRGVAPYGQGSYGYPQARTDGRPKGLAITALVFAITGFMTSLLYIGFPLAVAGLIMGIISLARKLGGKGMSIAAVSVATATLLWGVVLIMIFWAATALSESGIS
ncbi:hypothetical protein GCM10010922_22170 [Microbacterium sorbitolivorans]|uniref:DUF4190 domain-containing protein n=1 Tax=Microbacterium sorbitolivorans TaxID=1867410 RepID=A0A367XVC6_9MICO|nr:DUF4190 domain-containing protein [Microbacterium sorbitolivorans]RCK57180.1 hypothetical protein DTO57_12810 [Microbacterium sorbitolivorans]GGF46008.1 hypothetical protein GCM10010922_22170 [Microbacterium sorbitolivorans]